MLEELLKDKSEGPARCIERSKFYRQNKIFETHTNKFYREVEKSGVNVAEIPSEEQVREFWGKKKGHNEKFGWLSNFENSSKDIPEKGWEEIQVD